MKNIKKIALLTVISQLLILTLGCTKTEDRPPAPVKENVKGDAVEDKPVADGNWFIKDPTLDKVEGVGSQRAQAELGLKNQREIIVAVIDNGVDIQHEELKNKIWTNPGESGLDQTGHDKSNNGIDDDQNGYIDDVHGWNFLGGQDGRNVENETLELTRESLRYDQKIAHGDVLTADEKIYFDQVNLDFNKQLKEAQDLFVVLSQQQTRILANQQVLKDKIQLEDYSVEKLEAISSADTDVVQAKNYLLDISHQYRTVARFFRIYQATQSNLDFNLNKNFNPRVIVGDDPNDFTQTHYGNNDLKGADGSHGTHVAGIIAAEKNGVGIDGIAVNVKIMVLRAVPNGDERDKDIALAVRYAAANGANIINMSFGKKYSPSKNQVDEAFLFAASRGVLLVHAAGNDAENNDTHSNYPNRNVLASSIRQAPLQVPTWIEVGASSKDRGFNFIASFSNYGKKDVDLFAPGVQIKSSIPGNNYAVYSGTSMASPAAAGVAALLMSNFDAMTAQQAKAILLHQVRPYDALEVHLPGTEVLDLPVPFANLSATGGVIDAYKSIVYARELTN